MYLRHILRLTLLLLGAMTGCSQFCPVPGGCAPISHDPHAFDSHEYEIKLTDATNGRIVSGYSDIDVSVRMNDGAHAQDLVVGPRGGLVLITPAKQLATGISVKAFGYEPYVAEIGENERKITVKLQPVTTGEYVRYTGVVTDVTTGKGVQVRAARLLYTEMRYRMIYIYDDGTFDFLANVKYLPRRIAVQARGYAGYDADLPQTEQAIAIRLRPVSGDTVWLNGIISDAATRNNVPSNAGLTARIHFSDGSDEALWLRPDGWFQNGFTVNANRLPREVIVTAAGYETFRADLPAALERFDIALRRINSQPPAGSPVQ
jgi:hypothetical protein